MSEWKEVKINEIGKVVTGNTPASKNPQDFGSEMMFVTPSDYGSYVKFINSTKRFLSDNGIKRLANRVLPENSIMVTCIGSDMGKVAMNQIPVITNQQINSIIPFKDLADPHYVYYKLIEEYDTLRVLGGDGTALPIINKSTFENISILLPPLTQQKSIAEVLSSLDDKIDLLHQQNKTLEALAETLFRQWFDDDNSEWEETNLGSVVEILRGLSYKGAGLSDSNDVNAIPMINLNSVNEGGGFKYTGTKYYNGEYKERHLIIPGDVVITNTEQGHEHRLIGFSAIIPNSIGPKAIFSQHIYKLKPKDTRVTSLFINYLLNYSSLRDQVIGATNGSTVNMLSLEGLEKCKIQLPPKSLITKFEAFAKDIQAKKEVNVNQINQLETLRNNLLPKLMSGAVTVSSQ